MRTGTGDFLFFFSFYHVRILSLLFVSVFIHSPLDSLKVEKRQNLAATSQVRIHVVLPVFHLMEELLRSFNSMMTQYKYKAYDVIVIFVLWYILEVETENCLCWGVVDCIQVASVIDKSIDMSTLFFCKGRGGKLDRCLFVIGGGT